MTTDRAELLIDIFRSTGRHEAADIAERILRQEERERAEADHARFVANLFERPEEG